MDRRETLDALASLFTALATADFAGYCPIYERIALAIADDPESVALLLDDTPATARTPVLFLAVTHDLVLRGADPELAAIYRGASDADPWPPFRHMVQTEAPAILDLMRTRTTQTNEVGRSANLLPIHRTLGAQRRAQGDHRPLALVEIGPSAGLNLFADQYDIAYEHPDGTIEQAGDPRSSVHLHCELRGAFAPSLAGEPPTIAVRTGLDPAPIDLRSDAECRWLRACVWPGVPDRPERLAGAIEQARAHPPVLHTGDAATDLAPLLDTIDGDLIPVVTATWALAYLPGDRRRMVLETIDTIGLRRDIVLLTGEDPKVTPWVSAIDPAVLTMAHGDGTPTLFATRSWFDGRCTTTPVALCHPHGRSMHWLADHEEHAHG